MDVDEFMARGFSDLLNGTSDESDDSNDTEDEIGALDDQSAGDAAATSVPADPVGSDDNEDEDEDENETADVAEGDVSREATREANEPFDAGESSDDDVDDDDDSDDGAGGMHRASLDRLKKEQPEFYKYLLDNDKVRTL